MKTKKRLIGITLISFIAMLLSSNVAFPTCPKPEYAPYELRAHIRTIAFDFLSDQASSPHTVNEIFDLLDFYKLERGNLLVSDCNVRGARTNTLISDILAKSIAYVVECNDGFDNDRDGKIDLDDAGCTGSSDEDETNCGDSVCEASESCSSCSSDCGICPIPAVTILAMKSVSENAASFNDYGDLILKGLLKQNADLMLTPDDEFIFKNYAGEPVAILNLLTGNMLIAGNIFKRQSSLTPDSPSDFVVKDTNGNVVSYIDSRGNLYLKGSLTEGPVERETFDIPLWAGTNYIGVPLQLEGTVRASSLAQMIAYQGGKAESIIKFDASSQNWVAWNSIDPNTNNFNIKGGEGYSVYIDTVPTGNKLSITGIPYSRSVPLSLVNGWNFISVPFPAEGYTADTLEKAISDQGGTFPIIYGWDAEKQGYETGNFIIEPYKGYLIVISSPVIFWP